MRYKRIIKYYSRLGIGIGSAVIFILYYYFIDRIDVLDKDKQRKVNYNTRGLLL